MASLRALSWDQCSSVSSSLTEIVRHPQYADDMKLSGAVAEGHDPIQDPGQI